MEFGGFGLVWFMVCGVQFVGWGLGFGVCGVCGVWCVVCGLWGWYFDIVFVICGLRFVEDLDGFHPPPSGV